ncbi:MAG TPA: hypothetical protein VEW42_01660 [Candidatus Eisenbacteria bacterium]|nr:hypothetical protein [Candidatus Eisenbacteria bacterium]
MSEGEGEGSVNPKIKKEETLRRFEEEFRQTHQPLPGQNPRAFDLKAKQWAEAKWEEEKREKLVRDGSGMPGARASRKRNSPGSTHGLKPAPSLGQEYGPSTDAPERPSGRRKSPRKTP